jgi:7-keto-8-aminopelargonate synthetase-like enzyme
MKKFNRFYRNFEVNYDVVQRANFNPYYPVLQSGLDDSVTIKGEDYIDLASNNYLGLANDLRVKRAGIEAIEKYGMSLCATPIASGYSELYHHVEQKLSDFVGLERGIIYPSCYQANNGLFPVIAGEEDIALIDRCAHSSLIEGVKSSGCKIWPFLHNNLENLEATLKKATPYRRVFIVTESVFSTEGEIAPFKEIVQLAEKYNAIPVIDDSHGIGVLGEKGRGILEFTGLKDFQGIYTASLGKALANSGGIICGKNNLIDYLKYFSSHLVYSTSLNPCSLAGIASVLDIIEGEFSQLNKKIHTTKIRINEALQKSGFNMTKSITPILSIKSGDSVSTLAMAKNFFTNKILTTPFIYPSVQTNEGRIRIIAGAKLTESKLAQIINIIGSLNKR